VILLAGVSFLSALVTGVIGIFKYTDKSILIIISTVSGALVLIFLLGEFLVPH
jgi:hypothetical protein